MKVRVNKYNFPESLKPIRVEVIIKDREDFPTDRVFVFDTQNYFRGVNTECNEEFEYTENSIQEGFTSTTEAEDWLHNIIVDLKDLVNAHRGQRWPEESEEELTI